MTSPEVRHILALSAAVTALGVSRAREVFDAVCTHTASDQADHEPPKTHTTRQERAMETIGAAIVATLPPPKPRGRKVDPNSPRQRVWRYVSSLLKKSSMTGAEVLKKVEGNFPDIGGCTRVNYVYTTPGVNRNYGKWTLAPRGN